MPTNIIALPELSIPCFIESNQDWIDAVSFFDAAGRPVALDGIDFRLQVRVSADLPDVLVDASTDNGLLQLLSSGFSCLLHSPGVGYQVGDFIYLAGGDAIAPAVIEVTAVKVVSFGIFTYSGGTSTSGAGFAVGQTVSLVPAFSSTNVLSSSPVIIGVDSVDSTGNITAYHLISGGVYTAPPSSSSFFAPIQPGKVAQMVFGQPVYGIAGVKLSDPGIYNALPTNPTGQQSSTGVGIGATFDLGLVGNAIAIQIPADKLVHPLIEAAGTYQIQAMADGYVQNVASGPMTVTQGIVR